MSSIWITGAHGFIGQHLARWLAQQTHLVSGLGHGAWPEAETAQAGITHWLNGDITASNLHILYTAYGPPDTIFHLAGGASVGQAVANPREDFFRTVATTAELLEWLRQTSPQTRLVAVSSAAVYGAGHEGAIAENAALCPYSPYGHHKLMMESLCRSYGATYGLRSVIVRLFSVYGAGLRKQLLWDICSKLASGADVLELGGSGKELRDWTEIRDVVSALDRVKNMADAQVPSLNIGTGTATSVCEVAKHVIAAWRPTLTNCQLKFSGQSRLGDPFSLVADNHRLKKLEFECKVSLKQGIVDYVHWFQSGQLGGK